MTRVNYTRTGCKDVFRSFLVRNAVFDGELEIPCILPEVAVPNKLIQFSKAVSGRDYDAWVHFYEDDAAFERLWNEPKRYLPILARYRGVITPDFSLYRDMPLVMQHWNVYRSRAIGTWLQSQGIHVIVNVRWGDERTYRVCCAGVPRKGTIAIGSHGCIKLQIERHHFTRGLEFVAGELQPRTIVVYGSAPNELFDRYRDDGINILQFESMYAQSHRKVAGV